MRRAAAALLAAAILVPARPAEARRAGGHGARGTVLLAGERVAVRWTDGDTFLILSGPQRGRRARLSGVNCLETFGPVHRMGASDGQTLLAIAKGSAAVAAAAGGPCEIRDRPDGYGRLLARCSDAASALVRAGHAMVFAIDGPADPGLLALQREAQRARAGIWSGGAPPLVPTSLHSADEPDLGAGGAYDRIADTRTGLAEVHPHGRTYRTCEEVCLGDGPERACMTYVPFKRRYRDPPACLR